MWKKCTNCKGEGYLHESGKPNTPPERCPVCRGTRIISLISGLPPEGSIKSKDNYKNK